MSENKIQQAEPEAVEPDTDEEFKTLYNEAMDGRDRFESLAKAAEVAGHPEIASVYREVSAGVLGLLGDTIMSTAGALLSVEDTIDSLPGGEGGGSSLLEEDAEKYLALFDQYLRLLDGLEEIVPSGVEGDAQREVFNTLRRLTNGLAEFTKSITEEDEDEDPEDPEETGEDPEEDPEE